MIHEVGGHEGPTCLKPRSGRGLKGVISTKRQKDIHEGPEGPAKGREGGPRRNSKGLEKTRKGSVKGHEERHEGQKDIHEGARRTAKGH